MSNSAFQSSIANLNVSLKISQDGSQIYAADGGATDDYVISLNPALTSYTTGLVINFKANTANTTAGAKPTLNINGLGAKQILKNHDASLVTNDIEAGQIVTVVYDGTYFQMQSQIANASGGGGGTGITWVNQNSASVTMASNSGYVVNNGATLVTLTIPAAASLGDMFIIAGYSTGGWTVQANTGQVVNVGNSPTSTAGSVSSSNTFDCMTIVCVVANTTFVSYALQGNLTVA